MPSEHRRKYMREYMRARRSPKEKLTPEEVKAKQRAYQKLYYAANRKAIIAKRKESMTEEKRQRRNEYMRAYRAKKQGEKPSTRGPGRPRKYATEEERKEANRLYHKRYNAERRKKRGTKSE